MTISAEEVRSEGSKQDIRGLLAVSREALSLLTRPQRRHLWVLSTLNMMVALLDLVGLLLLGGLVLSLGALGSQEPPESVIGAVRLPVFMPEGAQGAFLLLGTAFLLLISKSVIASLLGWRTLHFLGRTQAQVSLSLTRRVLDLPIGSIRRRSPQELNWALLLGAQAAVVGMVGSLALSMAELALLVLLATALFAISPLSTLVAAFLFGTLAVLLHYTLGKRASAAGLDGSRANTSFMQTLERGISMLRELRTTAAVPRLEAALGSDLTVSSRAVAANAYLISLPKYLYESVLLIGTIAIAALQLQFSSASEAFSLVAIFLVAGMRMMPSLLRLQGYLLVARNAYGLAAQTLELARDMAVTPHAETQLESRTMKPVTLDAISFIGVSVASSTAGRDILDSVDLSVVSGEYIAITGPTGAGKSSLLDVILGAVIPTHGAVYLRGRSPLEYFTTYPGDVGFVPQNVELLPGTVRQNLDPFGALNISDTRMWDVLEQVGLLEWLVRERHGLDTEIGHAGAFVSGGQRQRIGLARALVNAPSILLLDEATSQLDASTEESITSVLERKRGEVTQIVVAHRLSTIVGADRVIYLDQGTIVADGSFATVRRDVPDFDRAAEILGL